MPYYLQIEEKQDYEWLLRSVQASVAKARDNPSIYCEYIDMYERVLKSLESATKDAPASPPAATVPAATPEPKPRAPRRKKEEIISTLPKLCETHPTYGAKKRPRTDCETCWAAYERYNGKAATQVARLRFQRKNRA